MRRPLFQGALAKPTNDGIAVCMICLLDPVHALRSAGPTDPRCDDLPKAAPTDESRPPAPIVVFAGCTFGNLCCLVRSSHRREAAETGAQGGAEQPHGERERRLPR